MNKKLFLTLAAIVAVVVAGAAVYAINKDSSPEPGDSSLATKGGSTEINSPQTSQPITVVGTVQCLAPKSSEEAQSTSCAIGLQQADGKSYALSAQDPTTTGGLPTGSQVQVTGLLSQPSSQFDINGVITVQSLQKL